jgi:hypothetical protein
LNFPGTFAIHFCRQNPQLTATVFDLPTTRPFAEKTIKRFDLEDRIDFQGGNYLKDEIEGHYDAAWHSHILHAEGPDGCRPKGHSTLTSSNPQRYRPHHRYRSFEFLN